MATSGPKSGATFDQEMYGGFAWLVLSNLASSNDAYATCAVTDGIESTNDTDRVLVTNLGFDADIGESDTILGVEFDVEAKASIASGANLLSGFLVVDGVISGNELNADGNLNTADQIIEFGSATELAGLSLTAAQVRSSGFGVAFYGNLQPGNGAAVISVDHVTVTVHYTAAGGGSGACIKLSSSRRRRM